MKEIKFRVWHKKEKQMILGGEFVDLIRNTCFNGNTTTNINPTFSDMLYESVDEDIQLMQYTGLKDKNEKEIYEGDVVSVFLKKPNMKDEGTPIIFENGEFSPKGFGHRDWWKIYEIEITGNIYENSELIERNNQ